MCTPPRLVTLRITIHSFAYSLTPPCYSSWVAFVYTNPTLSFFHVRNNVPDPDPDPDPASRFDADPDPYPTFHFAADPDLTFFFYADPNFQIKAQNLEKVLN